MIRNYLTNWEHLNQQCKIINLIIAAIKHISCLYRQFHLRYVCTLCKFHILFAYTTFCNRLNHFETIYGIVNFTWFLMDIDSEESKLDRFKSDESQDILKTNQASAWLKWVAVGLTVVSCLLYVEIFLLISKYQSLVAQTIRELPLSTRIMLNIYQPFLVVFIIVSIALWILFRVSIKKPGNRYWLILILIGFNLLVSGVLLGISYIKVD